MHFPKRFSTINKTEDSKAQNQSTLSVLSVDAPNLANDPDSLEEKFNHSQGADAEKNHNICSLIQSQRRHQADSTPTPRE